MSTIIESDWENTRLKGEIESLRQQLAEKDAEIERLKYAAENPNFNGRFDTWQAVAGKYRGEAEDLTKQLTASQAREQQLREALEDWQRCELDEETVDILLSIPADTAALQSMIAKAGEVMRERCADKAFLHGFDIDDKIRALPPITLKDLE